MDFVLYNKKRLARPSPSQILIIKQREKYLQMQLLSKNKTDQTNKHDDSKNDDSKNEIVVEHEKDVIVYELGVEAELESLEIPEPKLEEPVIQELSEPYHEQEDEDEETRETRETREMRETRETRETREMSEIKEK